MYYLSVSLPILKLHRDSYSGPCHNKEIVVGINPTIPVYIRCYAHPGKKQARGGNALVA